MKIPIPIQITNIAWKKIIEISTKKNTSGFIFSAKSGGCNGFNYNLQLLNKDIYKEIVNKEPIILEKEKIKLVIDPLTEIFLLGTKIDYISEDYDKGIFESKFIFEPDKKLASSCGCGISFTPKNIKD